MIRATHTRSYLESGEECGHWEYTLSLKMAQAREEARAWAAKDAENRTATVMPDGSIVMTIEGMTILDTWVYAEVD